MRGKNTLTMYVHNNIPFLMLTASRQQILVQPEQRSTAVYTLAFPMPEASPSCIARFHSLACRRKPAIENNIPWDVVEPLYPTEHTGLEAG